MEFCLETNKLCKQYKGFKALDGLSMHVPKGAIYGFIGKNGAGKTTLIRLICGLQEPTGGSYTLYGEKNADKGIFAVRRRMGAVVETPSIYLDMTAEENIVQQYRILGIPSMDGISELLALVGLAHTGKKKAKNFSLGMRQRLGIAIALCGSPDFLVLDEPVNGLDPEGIVDVRNMLKKLCAEQGMTILISSHLLSELSELCTDFAIINEGRLVDSLSSEELKEKCRSYAAIRTNDINFTSTILEQKLNVTKYKVVEHDEIHLYERLDELEKVSKTITDSGLILTKLVVEGENLEEYYLSKVSGNQRKDCE